MSTLWPRFMGHNSNWLGLRVGEVVEGGRMDELSFFRAFLSCFQEVEIQSYVL